MTQADPVSAEVLDAAPLRLVCCARGGPVNVDVAEMTASAVARLAFGEIPDYLVNPEVLAQEEVAS